jgi:hypothetical protein
MELVPFNPEALLMSILPILKSLAILVVFILLWNARSPTRSVTQARKMSSDPEIAKLSGTITEVRSKEGKSLVKIENRHGHSFWAIVRNEMIKVGDQMSFEMTVPRHHFYAEEFGLSLPECYIVSVFDVQPAEATPV